VAGDKDRVDERYGRSSRWRALAVGIPLALCLIALGGYWTLLSWGALGGGRGSTSAGVIGPILAGFGVALGYVCLRPRP
jgi:hypothetical protein